jgi:hypothetical protein
LAVSDGELPRPVGHEAHDRNANADVRAALRRCGIAIARRGPAVARGAAPVARETGRFSGQISAPMVSTNRTNAIVRNLLPLDRVKRKQQSKMAVRIGFPLTKVQAASIVGAKKGA